MSCIRCNSDRILSVNAHSKDLGCFEIYSQEHDGYVPEDLGIGGGDDVEFDLCLDCGQMQGKWPLPQSKLERKAAKAIKARNEPSEFARSIVDHVIKTNDGDVTAVLALILTGWLTESTNDTVTRVADCINALTDEPLACSMGLQLRTVLEDWDHWAELEPLISEDEDDDEDDY